MQGAETAFTWVQRIYCRWGCGGGVHAEEDAQGVIKNGENAKKFEVPDMILKAEKDIEAIKVTVDNMKILWDHIDVCQKKFE